MGDSETGQVSLEAAKVYDEFYLPALFQEWCPLALSSAKIGAGHHVLDVACGTGALAMAASELVGERGRVVGVDINEGMLEVARQKSSSITWANAPAEHLPFEDNQFDSVLCQFGLMYFEDKAAALSEMHRVLKQHGVLAILVWSNLENNPGLAAEEYLWQRLLNSEIDNTPYGLGDRGILENLFRHLDLRDLDITSHPGTGHFNSVREWIHTGAKGWTDDDALSDTQLAQLVDMAETDLAYFETQDGKVAFPTSAYIVSGTKR